MTTVLATYDVYNAEANAVREIALVEGLTAEHLEFVAKEWSPKLITAHGRAIIEFHGLPAVDRTVEKWRDIEAKFGAPDWDWDWTKKHGTSLTNGHEVYGLLDESSVETLMVLNPTHTSKLQSSGNAPAVYVEYLAIAPWNRQPIQDPPRYRGFGRVMLGVAVSSSVERKMLGRCGLHALHSAEGFYTRVGMEDLGLDEAAGSDRYFEFSPEGAAKFLGEKN